MQPGATGNQGQGWGGCQEDADACVLLRGASEGPERESALQVCVTSESGEALACSLFRVLGTAVQQFLSSKVLGAETPECLHHRGSS